MSGPCAGLVPAAAVRSWRCQPEIVPPQLLDVVGAAGECDIDDVLGELRVGHVGGRRGVRRWRARGDSQVVVMPAVNVSPQLVDVAVGGAVVDRRAECPDRRHVTGRGTPAAGAPVAAVRPTAPSGARP